MRPTISLILKRKDYHVPIFIGSNILEKIFEQLDIQKYSRCLVVYDTVVKSPWATNVINILKKRLPKIHTYTVIGSENIKSLKNTEKIYTILSSKAFDRKSLLIAIGGGTIGDLVGFVAATYMRGIDYISIPTTLLSQVDAGIGGKTGVNFNGYKNIIGSFHQPKTIIIDTETLNTLPINQFNSGMAEVIKYAIALDPALWIKLKKINQTKLKKELPEIIKTCVLLKVKIVREDEKEKGIRVVLNFGHTIGHAIESLTKKYTHGEAISIGMVKALEIGIRLKLTNPWLKEELIQVLNKYNLPTKLEGLNPEKIWQACQKDKKSSFGEIKWVLLKDIGRYLLNQKVEKRIVMETLK